MKKEIKSLKKAVTMEKKAIPKRMQTIMSKLTDFIVEVSKGKGDTRQKVEDRHEDLLKLLKLHSPVQKAVALKKVKDPDAPKRAKSSYIYFCCEKRNDIKKSNADMSATDIIKELGRVWRDDTSDKEKARFTKMSEKDKERYLKEMETYIAPDLGYVPEKKVKVKRTGPKRGLTSYIFFCNKHRSVIKEDNPELSTKEITAELGKQWRELSDKDKKPFVKLANADKNRYEKEKETWVEPEPVEPTKKAKKTATKKAPVKKKSAVKEKVRLCFVL